jgi:hypothetical protein
MIGGVAPKLVDLTDAVLFGDVWERPGLSRRDRSLVAVTAGHPGARSAPMSRADFDERLT